MSMMSVWTEYVLLWDAAVVGSLLLLQRATGAESCSGPTPDSHCQAGCSAQELLCAGTDHSWAHVYCHQQCHCIATSAHCCQLSRQSLTAAWQPPCLA